MFSPNSLNLLPTDALASVSDSLTAKASSQAKDLASEQQRNDRLAGTTEFDSINNGKTTTKLANTGAGVEKYAGMSQGATSVAGMADTLVQGGKEPYDPDSLAPGTTADADSIAEMQNDVDAAVGSVPTQASEALNLALAEGKAKIAAMQSDLQETQETLNQVNDVISKRASGELPNPSLNVAELDEALEEVLNQLEQSGQFSQEQLQSLRAIATASNEERLANYERFVVNNIALPFSENKARLDILKARALGIEADSSAVPIFDTVYGPPVSTEGKFILSQDGIYYDSRTGSIPFITARQIDSLSWQLRYESNRGGRGQEFTQDSTLRFADTILSDDYENETPKVFSFYEYDPILHSLETDRDLQIRDVKNKVQDLIASGYSPDSAVIKNYEESYGSVAYTYDRKIKKRKKQLQVAALFGPFGVTIAGDPRGEGLFYREYTKQQPLIEALSGDQKVQRISFSEGTQSSSIEFIPNIPVNDFSYLKDVGLVPEIESQKQAMLHSSDLDDTTAPIVPVFLEQGPGATYEGIPELAVPPYGATDWITTSGDTDSLNASGHASSLVLGTVPYLRTLDDGIVTDSLVVCYNFLESDATTTPETEVFGVRNYAPNGYPLNAKMVGDASSIFISGISIPYLTGSLYRPGDKYGIRYSYLPKGSYVRLPNNYRENRSYLGSQPIDDLMYNKDGWTMEFWAYTPNLYDGMTTDHRYKLVAANENCGDPVTRSLSTSVYVTAATENGQDGYPRRFRTKGMIVGFRDKGEPGTDVSAGLEFVVLPTVAQNDPKWGKSVAIAESVSGDGTSPSCRTELGFKIPASATTESGYSISSASTQFTHYGIVCDIASDSISLYVNGEFMLSANTSTSFDTKPGMPLQIPSRIGEGHFHEHRGVFGEKLYDGNLPEQPIFTPWILGGGFTDGIQDSPQSLLDTTVPGFLGTNTNSSYFQNDQLDVSGGPVGQHSVLGGAGVATAGLGGYERSGSNYLLARSGLDGHLGSFKMYAKPLSKLEVQKNYKAQSPFFGGISRPHQLL